MICLCALGTTTGLIDYIVAKKLFNFFLNDGCIPLTRDHRLMDKMVKAASDNG